MSIDLETLEKRLTAMEGAITEIQRKLGLIKTAPNWIEQITGIVKDQEVFEEMLRYGREYRQTTYPPDEPVEPAA